MKSFIRSLLALGIVAIGSQSAMAVIPTPVSLWEGEGNAVDSFGSNDGTLNGDTTFTTGRFVDRSSYVNAGDSTLINLVE